MAPKANKIKIKIRGFWRRQPKVEDNQPEVSGNQAGVENDQPDAEAGPSNAGDREVDIRRRDKGKEVEVVEYTTDDDDVPVNDNIFCLLFNLATFGARLFKPRQHSQNIGCLVVTGHGYPIELFDTLKSWNVSTVTRHYYELPINRVHITYEKEDRMLRTLSHQDPPYAPVVRNLRGDLLLTGNVFHLACVPFVVTRQLRYLMQYRADIGLRGVPDVVWQPVHVKAVAEVTEDPKEQMNHAQTLECYRSVLPLVSAFMLSYQELGDIAGGVGYPLASEEQAVRNSVEILAQTFPSNTIGIIGDGVLIVCCEPFGYYYRQGKEKGWVKSYSQYSDRKAIVDFTGGRTAFLGAFTVGLIDKIKLRESCLRGAVAASFAMEQFGLPILSWRHVMRGGNSANREFWNSDRALHRLRALRSINDQA
ncbi:hypothetical protein F4680DRAFT_443409 [Xylaria scruposa]|nr:hypothetical protein F4680DRAFT_443409 [Xylaria scruposa]